MCQPLCWASNRSRALTTEASGLVPVDLTRPRPGGAPLCKCRQRRGEFQGSFPHPFLVCVCEVLTPAFRTPSVLLSDHSLFLYAKERAHLRTACSFPTVLCPACGVQNLGSPCGVERPALPASCPDSPPTHNSAFLSVCHGALLYLFFVAFTIICNDHLY